MRKKLSLVAAGLLAGATLSVGVASPASAQECTSDDPVLAYVCRTIGDADPIGWVNHYYWVATGAVHWAYCQVSPHC